MTKEKFRKHLEKTIKLIRNHTNDFITIDDQSIRIHSFYDYISVIVKLSDSKSFMVNCNCSSDTEDESVNLLYMMLKKYDMLDTFVDLLNIQCLKEI